MVILILSSIISSIEKESPDVIQSSKESMVMIIINTQHEARGYDFT